MPSHDFVRARAPIALAIFMQIDVNDEVALKKETAPKTLATRIRRELPHPVSFAPLCKMTAWHVPLFLFFSRSSSSSPAWSHTSTWPFRPLFSLLRLIARSTRVTRRRGTQKVNAISYSTVLDDDVDDG